MATLGLDYVPHKYKPEGSSKEIPVKIWDTAGQERFRTLTHSFYKNANGVILVYDVTNEASYHSIKTWLQSIKDNADPNICKVLVANKIDMRDDRKISE
mmetsp:Transcript_45206/g.61314  ORF Transcript_45206/g.61314 Transcript_45206/m.61314 type:complete len:99 (+) Transcript_45206:124-420(+)|eukprot:CAMPEP_0176373226 /NCGR_PEP_ID=MMETSP0126-20121128/25898_1 /TAXON_ID=141414 ORGANISM="Strombidinopsis acuminatum, Strain SPMC142" /NCGR_SAMPLE_ID=MMETSP0126 /ASSEMBLY_ACC=CAM_ASM_000229 /LENGTH=98 /DNA_ID=CAMNT_0017733295 /DNA_START=122 /DNA_END=418 /DNA_ORIENTATION=+